MNRHIPPQTSLPTHIDILPTAQQALGNRGRIAIVNGGTQDVLRATIITESGSRYQQQMLQARITSAMLMEGTRNTTALQMAEQLDFMGSIIETTAGADFSLISMLTTHQHLERTLSMLADVLQQPAFPQHELDIVLRKQKQNFIVSQDRVDTQARKALMANIFGSDHPYGRTASLEHFNAIDRQHLIDFHKSHYLDKPIMVVLAGQVGDREIALVERYLGQGNATAAPHTPLLAPPATHEPIRTHWAKPDALQCAIHIGKPTITRRHPDFPALMVLNTVLGGYFGSRLMTNLREEKGYTYGIGSILMPYRDACLLSIKAEVGANHTESAIAEIMHEMDCLRQTPIPPQELELVKNYLMGELLRQFDGPFATADTVMGAYQHNDMDLDYRVRTIDTVRTVTSAQLLQLAQQHLTPKGLVISTAGGPALS